MARTRRRGLDSAPADGETGCDIASGSDAVSVPVRKRRSFRTQTTTTGINAIVESDCRHGLDSAPADGEAGCEIVLRSAAFSAPVCKRGPSRPVSKQITTGINANDESDEDGDGNHIKLRWSSARVSRFVKTLRPNQKDFIVKHGFGYILDIKSFRVPIGFIEWVISNVSPSSYEFLLNQKCIHFKKDMVTKVLGITSGDKPVEVSTTDFEVEALVEKYKSEYKQGHTYPIKKCMNLMLKEDDEHNFMRHFMLFLISTIFMPGKSNTLCVEYLYSLVDLSLIKEYDWAGEVLRVVMHEVRRFHGLRDSLGRADAMKHFYVAGCLPLLAIVYSDFLDLPQGSPNVHSLNYSVPRICNLSSRDFDFIMEIDSNNRAGPHVYGMHPFRDISCTPYCTSPPVLPGIPQTLIHPDVQRLVDKQKMLWKGDFSLLTKTFNDMLENWTQSFAADFNTLYRAKIDELSANTSSAPNAIPSNGETLAGPSGSRADRENSSSPSGPFPSNIGQPSSEGLVVPERNDVGNQDGVAESSLPIVLGQQGSSPSHSMPLTEHDDLNAEQNSLPNHDVDSVNDVAAAVSSSAPSSRRKPPRTAAGLVSLLARARR